MNMLKKLITPFRRLTGKEFDMADQANTATTPAASGVAQTPTAQQLGVTHEQLQQMVSQAIASALQPLSQKIAGLEAGVGKAATLESVQKAVADQVAASQAAQSKSSARAKFIAEKMADVPAAYLASLGDDETKFGDQEKSIRDTLKADLAKLGVKAAPVATDAGGQKPAAAIDTSKLSSTELISLGVRQTQDRGQAKRSDPLPATAPADAKQADAPAAK